MGGSGQALLHAAGFTVFVRGSIVHVSGLVPWSPGAAAPGLPPRDAPVAVPRLIPARDPAELADVHGRTSQGRRMTLTASRVNR